MPTISRTEAIKLSIPRDKWVLHTILIPLTYSIIQAKKWLDSHGYQKYRHRTTKNFHRYNQGVPAVSKAAYNTVTLDNGIELVYLKYS